MIYIVTGVSKGIGKAIVKHLLAENQKVIGIGRSNTMDHPNFQFIELDLSDLSAIKKVQFELDNEAVTLINNAGSIGNIQRLSEQNFEDLEEILNINTIAPFALVRQVYAQLKNKSLFTLVNISSGAALRPIPSWASYCASKAALNMLTETFYLEEKELGHNIKAYAVAPGVVDTAMQEKIRKTPEREFSGIQRFRQLKAENELWSPDLVAQKLFRLLSQPFMGQVIWDLRLI